MEFTRSYTTIDAHAAGEPLRIVTGGVPPIPGTTILEKRRWVREHLDEVRRALMWEPRGHADMYGGFVTPPVTPDADIGVIFMHNEGYSDMCGHGIIALATVLVAQGMVRRATPETRVGVDTPAGFVEAFVAWDGRRTGEARFTNVPSFLYRRDLTVTTASVGEVRVDVAFGGAFYAYLDAADAGLSLRHDAMERFKQVGDEIKQAVTEAIEVVHPLEPELRGIYGTIFSGPPTRADADQANVCIFADRQVDRSPTGTGTAGRVAQLVARGSLALGQPLANESAAGTLFTGRALRTAAIGPFEGVVPEIAGRAAIVGTNTWWIDPEDEVGDGFLLR
ncbi:MAG: proline racemase family protein [Deinococcales bacterium]